MVVNLGDMSHAPYVFGISVTFNGSFRLDKLIHMTTKKMKIITGEYIPLQNVGICFFMIFFQISDKKLVKDESKLQYIQKSKAIILPFDLHIDIPA